MTQVIVGVLNFVLGRTDRWRDQTQEQRLLVAAYLESLSDCLLRVAADLRADRVPHAACEELRHYARQLPDTVRREMGEAAPELLESLRGAVQSRGAAVKHAEDLDLVRGEAASIEETAGRIKALAVSLKVG
jgi:hypothetical protein